MVRSPGELRAEARSAAAFRIGQADAAQFMLELIGRRRAMREVVTVAY